MSEKQAPHVEQALAEAAGAANEEQLKAARKRLEAGGYQAAAKARAAAAQDVDGDQGDGEDSKRRRAPQGRQAPGKQTG